MSNIILFSSSPLRIEVCSPTLVVLIADVMVSDCSPSDPPSPHGCPLPLHPLPPSQVVPPLLPPLWYNAIPVIPL